MLKYKSIHIILVMLCIVMMPNITNAELKMGIVNLDVLFKEILV